MVIHVGALKDKRYDEIEEEIRRVHEACQGRALKVIIETCLLAEEEKIAMCGIVTRAGLCRWVIIYLGLPSPAGSSDQPETRRAAALSRSAAGRDTDQSRPGCRAAGIDG